MSFRCSAQPPADKEKAWRNAKPANMNPLCGMRLPPGLAPYMSPPADDGAVAASVSYELLKGCSTVSAEESPKYDDRSTAIGSGLSDASDDVDVESPEDNWLAENDNSESEEESAAKEEAEFSLDGRLSSIKRWRRFQALQAAGTTGLTATAGCMMDSCALGASEMKFLSSQLEHMEVPVSVPALAREAAPLEAPSMLPGVLEPCVLEAPCLDAAATPERATTLPLPPGLRSMQCTVTENQLELPAYSQLAKLPLPPGLSAAHSTAAGTQPDQSLCAESAKLPLPPGLSEMAGKGAGPTFNLVTIGASTILHSCVPGLADGVRLLSQRALEVDAWRDLLEPEPDDPEWQLLALVGQDSLVGFSTYALFPEDRDDASKGLIMSVHHVVIDEALRGMGHGRAMLQELISRARGANAWAVKLHSLPPAVVFYQRLGFRLVGDDGLMEMRL